jgi:hypothetical protein
MQILRRGWSVAAPALVMITAILWGAASGLLASCGPFTDAVADTFCPFVLEIFYLGLTRNHADGLRSRRQRHRLQMAAFLGEASTEPSAAAARRSTSSGPRRTRLCSA